MAAMISLGRDEMGASVLERNLNAWIGSCSDYVSVSMARCSYFQEFTLDGSIAVLAYIIRSHAVETERCLSPFVCSRETCFSQFTRLVPVLVRPT